MSSEVLCTSHDDCRANEALARACVASAPVIAHLMTQDGQPYGSTRRCCEICGIMIWGSPHPPYTEDSEAFYARRLPEGYIACNSPEARTRTAAPRR